LLACGFGCVPSGFSKIFRWISVSDRYDLSERLPYLINRVGAALVGFASPGLKRRSLTIPLWRVLSVLAYRSEMRQVDLGGATSLDPPTVSRLISYAARRGLVTRERSDTSNREVSVRITKAGKHMVEQIVPLMVADEDVVMAGLSKAELATLRKILSRMYDNIAGRKETGKAKPADPPARKTQPRRRERF
jgi:MarR family transcriptional regulator, organic hydroperoxide resistance regulator